MDIAAEDSDDGGLQARSAATRRLQAISLGHGLSVVTGVYHIAIDAMNFRSFPFLMSVFNIPESLPPIVPRIYGLTRTQPALRHHIYINGCGRCALFYAFTTACQLATAIMAR